MMRLFLFCVVFVSLACATTNRQYTIDVGPFLVLLFSKSLTLCVKDLNAEIADPQLRDIFESAVHRMKDFTTDTDPSQVEKKALGHVICLWSRFHHCLMLGLDIFNL